MNLIVDFNNTVHRARAGFQRGENSITFTFMLMLRKMLNQFKPDRVYIVKEGKAKARREMFSEYKAHRESAGDDFWRQHFKILELLSNMPVHLIRHPERECDDTIAHICSTIHHDEECVIVSSDSDFIQLLENDSDRVKLYNPVKEIWIQATPYDYVAWKSLVGDSSDNIPGFKGIGPKRAEKFMTEPESLSTFLSQDNNKEIFDRNMSLIRFESIDGGLEHKLPSVDWSTLKQSFETLGFNSIISDKSWPKFTDSFSTIGG